MELADHEFQMNPYLPFCLFLAARVFVQLLRKVSEDSEVRSSLEFLLTAMDWLKRHNPLSESFLVQLTFDMRGSGLGPLMHDIGVEPSVRGCAGICGTVSSSRNAVLFAVLVLSGFRSLGARKMLPGLSIRKGRRAMEHIATPLVIFQPRRGLICSTLHQRRTILSTYPLASSGLEHSGYSQDMVTLMLKQQKK